MAGKRLTSIARKLRAEPTLAEQRLWSRLRGKQLGVRFTRQFPIGNYIVDFACRSARLGIEVDGGQHADSASDGARTGAIEAFGYRIIRFWNIDVLANTDGVIQVIADELALATNRKGWFSREEEYPDLP
jgi:very-short-patch-repair endonuclease